MKKLRVLLFVLLAVVFALPVAATVVLSFKTGFGGYADLLFNCFKFYPMFWNSVIYAAVITVVQLAVIISCAFGFSQAKFCGKARLRCFISCL